MNGKKGTEKSNFSELISGQINWAEAIVNECTTTSNCKLKRDKYKFFYAMYTVSWKAIKLYS